MTEPTYMPQSLPQKPQKAYIVDFSATIDQMGRFTCDAELSEEAARELFAQLLSERYRAREVVINSMELSSEPIPESDEPVVEPEADTDPEPTLQ